MHLFIQTIFIDYIPCTRTGDIMVIATSLGSSKGEKF